MDEKRFDFTRRGILAALGGLGLAAPLGIAEAKRGKTRKMRKDRRKVSAAASPNGSAPQDLCAFFGFASSPCDLTFLFTIPPGLPPLCPFPIKLEGFGKIKFIFPEGPLPPGVLPERLIQISPAQNFIVTNLNDPSKQVTLNTTGSGHVTFGPNREQIVVVTGSNLLYDPIVEPHLALTQGRFTFTVDAQGTLPPIEHREGVGNVTDVCALIA